MSAACPTFAFLVEIEIDPDKTPDASGLWTAFMQLVEQRGLQADGGRGHRFWTYRLHSESSQATNGDRTAVEGWLRARPDVLDVRVGELFDLSSLD